MGKSYDRTLHLERITPLGLVLFMLMFCTLPGRTAKVERRGNRVTVWPDKGDARVVRLQVVANRIIRVRATSASCLPDKPKSLMVNMLPDNNAEVRVTENPFSVFVKAKEVQAVVSKETGNIVFMDADGRLLLKEANEGKRFKHFRVPACEIGVDSAKIQEAQRNGLTWQLNFEPTGDALYGLGQHQSEELNMAGKNEELFQYNTKVSVPMLVASGVRNTGTSLPAVVTYGLLWDSYSHCRIGSPEGYVQLNRAFRLYDKEGREGWLTGTYTDSKGNTVTRREDSIYYEYDLPQKRLADDPGGIKNLPRGFRLKGAKVVYEGFLQRPLPTTAGNDRCQFMLYYAGYVKVYIGGQAVVPERWRTAWNPNTYKFTASIPEGQKVPIRVEWQPDGDVSYCGLRAVSPCSDTADGAIHIWSEMAQDMDYYFMTGNNMDQVIGQYRSLTGRAPILPKWALGFWQSRERYKTQDELLNTLDGFRLRHLPIDNIVQDWNYWPEDQWGSHRFEQSRYPDPAAMADSIHKMHGRLMLSVWPKFYCNTDHYKEFEAKGWMYRQAVTDDIHDWVGKGYVGSFYDAYDKGARHLFWQQLGGLSRIVDAWWMDASEPNVRDCTPMWYRKALCGPTALGTSTEYFNAYALVNAQAIYEGQRNDRPEQRVFLLTRSGFAGMQRYGAATWSGDIGTRWEDMRAQMTAGMNYSLAGLPYWGMDIGGFCVENRYVKAQQTFNNTGQETDDLREWRELQTRWTQFGAFVPLFRVHGQWPPREIWNIAPQEHPAYQSFAYYDHLRYRLMPYLYAMAAWVNTDHYTMMRALVMDFGYDRQTTDLKDQWMLGPSLMVCPVSQYKARQRKVYLPKNRQWYDLYTGYCLDGGRHIEAPAPLERMPVYVPAGSIIPFGPSMEWTDEKAPHLIHLYIYGGRNAQFTLYEDEGVNYNYEKGLYSTIDISYNDTLKTVTLGQRQGCFKGMLKQRQFNIVLTDKQHSHGLDFENNVGTMVEYDGQEKTIIIR